MSQSELQISNQCEFGDPGDYGVTCASAVVTVSNVDRRVSVYSFESGVSFNFSLEYYDRNLGEYVLWNSLHINWLRWEKLKQAVLILIKLNDFSSAYSRGILKNQSFTGACFGNSIQLVDANDPDKFTLNLQTFSDQNRFSFRAHTDGFKKAFELLSIYWSEWDALNILVGYLESRSK